MERHDTMMRRTAPSVVRRAGAGPVVTALATLIGLIAITAPVVPTGAAGAAGGEISANGEVTWGVYGMDTTTESDAIQSLVFAIEQIGNRIYVGGKFLEARPNASSPGVAQPYLVAFDAGTGALIPDFRPSLEGPVYALQASPDGSRLFVGGEFRSIDGDNEARGLAALDPATGAVDTTWRAKVTNVSGARGMVKSLTISGDQLYLSGRFDRVGGGNRPLHLTDKVARVALADGTADPAFATVVAGGAVWGVAVAPDGSKVYLAGYHDTVDGNPAGADFSVLDAANGRLIPGLSDVGGNSTNTDRRYGQDVVAVGDLVFWGGSEHIVRVFRISDGSLVREHSTTRGGDFQDLEVVGDRVYASCHCYTEHLADYNYWPNRPTIPAGVAVTPIKYVAAYSATTGEHLPSFLLDASAARAGVWAIHGDTAGCLWVGGDLTRITTVSGGDRAAGGFAKFCPGDGGDAIAPTTPTDLVQTRAEDRKVVLRWTGSTDNVAVAHYELTRDGAPVGTRAGGPSTLWFTDTELEPGTDYAYTVVAVDAAGNRSGAATITAATTGGPVVPVAPPAPTGLRSTLQTRERIVLTWDDTAGATGYAVERLDDTGFVEIGTKSGRWFTDTGLAPATTHRYRVVAVTAEGVRSAPSIDIDVATLP
ncbi:MAG: hypothetical protein ACFCVK_19015 [Acidimicrobiales bacterium]